jgi:hypothetical protein
MIGTPRLPRGALLAIGATVATLLVWRVLAVGIEAHRERGESALRLAAPGAAATDARGARDRLARNPADATALMVLALDLERNGARDDATAAVREALRLAPSDAPTLVQAAGYFLRSGEVGEALVALGRYADVAWADGIDPNVWPIFLAAFDSGQHRPFFDRVARDGPPWWPDLGRRLCERGSVEALGSLLEARVEARLATAEERRCVVGRLQRAGRWNDAYFAWLNSLPPDQRRRVGYVFNGDFALPLSNLGFDWLYPQQDGVAVAVEAAARPGGKHVLGVTFGNRRYEGPPISQFLRLVPGRYRFEGRGRTELVTWLGLQWALYCVVASGPEPRQLMRTDRFAGSADWRDFGRDFVVSGDCPTQQLRLELANPRREAAAPDSLVVRLKGRVWFEDLRVRFVD